MSFPHGSGLETTTRLSRHQGEAEARTLEGWRARGGYEALRRSLKRLGVPERSWRATRQALQERWHRREISNFEYLMQLNTLSGRTYNDLNQYPVFPWILSDYTSARLELRDPRTFRDLSKPVGALNGERLKQVRDRYVGMGVDGAMPPFHYGSHYSSAAATLFWLLRLEPYTSYAIELQSGRFDHADRLFHSLSEAWRSCNTCGAHAHPKPHP